MKSQIWCLCSVALCGGVLREGMMATAWPLGFCPGGSCTLALALVLEPRGSESALSPKSFLGPLRGDAWESHSFFHCPNPHRICSQKLWGLTFLTVELWAGWSGVGLGSLIPKVSLLIFTYHMSVLDCLFYISTSLSLLPIWMNVTSLIPWLSDFHTVDFLMILGDSCFVA